MELMELYVPVYNNIALLIGNTLVELTMDRWTCYSMIGYTINDINMSLPADDES